ncbi:hypothetical protein BRC75_00865 [Halobacteriales archaeon QH_7_69_31]|nr:MAG: hypothetical protein BRC75_00865 [Halobacteriales archaeon QH_7_69_31]
MTLLLTVSAVRRLDEPAAAVAEARAWSEHVGVVADGGEPVADVRQFVDGIEADPDLVAGQLSGSLADVRQRLRTDRHVLVGTTERQQAVAAALGWGFQHVEAAADAAEWSLSEADGPDDSNETDADGGAGPDSGC